MTVYTWNVTSNDWVKALPTSNGNFGFGGPYSNPLTDALLEVTGAYSRTPYPLEAGYWEQYTSGQGMQRRALGVPGARNLPQLSTWLGAYDGLTIYTPTIRKKYWYDSLGYLGFPRDYLRVNDPNSSPRGQIAGWIILGRVPSYSSTLPRETPLPHSLIDNYNNISVTGEPFQVVISTAEFSYTPKLFELPGLTAPVSHILTINIATKMYVTSEEEFYVHGVTRPAITVSPMTQPLGITLIRNHLNGNLEMRLNAPTYPELEDAFGVHILGEAINHTPPLDTETPNPSEYLYNSVDRVMWRRTPGYVIELFLNEDRTKFGVKFNGKKLGASVPLPETLTTYLTEQNHFLTTTMAAGMNFFRPNPVGFFGVDRDGMISILTAGTGVEPYIDPLEPVTGTRNTPLYMNRPDGLVSAPPWANLGAGWPGFSSVDRAALWQRNNPR